MDKSHNPPICKRCAASQAGSNAVNIANMFVGHRLNLSDKTKNIIRVCLCVIFAAGMGVTLFLQSQGFNWLRELGLGFLTFLPAFATMLLGVGGFAFLHTKHKRTPIIRGITEAQVNALLRTGEDLTAKRLASATNTSVEYAEKYLKDMAIAGKLNVEAGTGELVYTNSGLLLGGE
jgi:predicted transcriptional regulator